MGNSSKAAREDTRLYFNCSLSIFWSSSAELDHNARSFMHDPSGALPGSRRPSTKVETRNEAYAKELMLQRSKLQYQERGKSERS